MKITRLGSEKRSAKASLNASKSAVLNDSNKPVHSQTLDCLRQTIRERNDEIASCKNTIASYTNAISSLTAYVKSFESIWYKFKEKLENTSQIENKLNKIHMSFLSFYKDFESFATELTRNHPADERLNSSALQDQVVNLLKLIDSKLIDEWKTEKEVLFAELDQLCKNYESNNEVPLALVRK